MTAEEDELTPVERRGVGAGDDIRTVARLAIDQAHAASRRSVQAETLAQKAVDETRELKHNLFGYPDRFGDGGSLGALKSTVDLLDARLKLFGRQQWAILLLLLGAMATAMFAAFHR